MSESLRDNLFKPLSPITCRGVGMATELARDIRWLREHAQELQDKYPDMYVAVYDGGVIAADKDLKKVYDKARPYGERAIIKYVFPGDLFVL